MKRYQYKIKRLANQREITQLYHFTPVGNAESILRNGLVSRNILLENNVDFSFTDIIRLDNQLDAVSLSIHTINVDMFNAKDRDLKCDWIIIELDASILWTHCCRFCCTNAASSEIRKHIGFIKGPWAFEKMFEDSTNYSNDGKSKRQKFELMDYDPTNNDAEVQVLDPIEPDLIVDISVRNQRMKNKVENLMQKVEFIKLVVIQDF